MRFRFLRRKAAARICYEGDAPTWAGPPPLAKRSCCCPAKPVVRVLMPPTPARQHSVDLLLCGHHYCTSQKALAAVGAVVLAETGAVLMGTEENEMIPLGSSGTSSRQ